MATQPTRPQVVRIHNQLGEMGPVELRDSVQTFYETTSQTLSGLVRYPSRQRIEEVATVSQNHAYYDHVSRNGITDTPVRLNAAERKALVKEVDHSFSEKGMWSIILTVSLSAFLQGFVQSSLAGANLFADLWISKTESTDSRFAAANAAVYLSAAVIGCPLAAPVNALLGRRGAIFLAAFLILISSIGSAAIPLDTDEDVQRAWERLSYLRIVGGIGMGLKAVSTPIIAAECAIGYWRGSSILAWQLWVAFGIMTSFIVNYVLNLIHDADLKLRLILASPAVFALVLMVAVFKCPESFRYYLTPDSRQYNPEKAYGSLLRLRNTELQATRDLYLTHIGIEEEMKIEREAGRRKNETPTTRAVVETTDGPLPEVNGNHAPPNPEDPNRDNVESHQPHDESPSKKQKSGWLWYILLRANGALMTILRYPLKYWEFVVNRRLRNAVIASSVVALAQQLSGINLMAFYGGGFLVQHFDPSTRMPEDKLEKAMVYNVVFGLLNFLFCLPAIHYIDSLGRRPMLLFTIPGMAVGLMAAAVSVGRVREEVVAWWIYFHCMWYSPGMGPVPFILAAESFSLKSRETGASVPISINLLFAGLLTFIVPHLMTAIKYAGTLGLFAGFNVIAFISIFLLVEETGGIRLEALGLVFRERKRDFVHFQVFYFLPWFGRFIIGKETLATRPRRVVDEDRGGIQIQTGRGAGPSSSSVGADTADGDSVRGTAPMV